MCSNWTLAPGVSPKSRLPNSMLSALIRKWWPGIYTPRGEVPARVRKLALTWADYELAPTSAPYYNADDAVMTEFWVRHISRAMFIVDDPNVLTHGSHNCFMHD